MLQYGLLADARIPIKGAIVLPEGGYIITGNGVDGYPVASVSEKYGPNVIDAIVVATDE